MKQELWQTGKTEFEKRIDSIGILKENSITNAWNVKLSFKNQLQDNNIT